MSQPDSNYSNRVSAGGFPLWWFPVLFVPLIPKVRLLSLGGVNVILDDFVVACAVAVGFMRVLVVGAARGSSPISISPATSLFALLVAFKLVDLLTLGLFLPWKDFWGVGDGVLFQEGLLVLARQGLILGSFVLILSSMRSQESIYRVLTLFLICTATVVGLGVAQYLFLDHQILTSTFRPMHVIETRFKGIVDNPWLDQFGAGHEHLAAFGVMAGSIVTGLILNGKSDSPFSKPLLYVLAIGCLFVVIFASSRGGWIAAGFSLVVFAALMTKRGRVLQLLTGLVFVGGCLVAIDFVTSISLQSYVESRIVDLFGILSGEVHDDSAKYRIFQYIQLWEIFKENPILGLGPGGAGRIAEGQLIRELVEGGIVGSAIFVVMLAVLLRSGMRCYSRGRDPLTRGLGMGFVGGTSGILAQSFFTELFVVLKVAIPFWILAALVERSRIIWRLR